MKMKRLLVILISLVIFTACAQAHIVSKTKYREARLMPPEVAKKIIARYTSDQWAKHPGARWGGSGSHACPDQNVYPMPYETMTIFGAGEFVSLAGGDLNVFKNDFFCGGLIARIKVPPEERDDFIEALISMGAKVKVNNN